MPDAFDTNAPPPPCTAIWRTSENNASDVYSNSYYSHFLINTAVGTNTYQYRKVLSGTEDGITLTSNAGPTAYPHRLPYYPTYHFRALQSQKEILSREHIHYYNYHCRPT